jgi:hypothetical protein
LHDGEEREILMRDCDSQFFGRFSGRGLCCCFSWFEVAGGRGDPAAVHVSSVRALLEKDLVTASQVDVGRWHESEPILAAHAGLHV